MKRYSLKHLSNEVLRRELSDKAAREKEATAELLAHIAEFDERKLYLPAGYPSMHAYCVGELRLSDEAAAKRLFVARAARRCPEVFEALAAGRVHLSGLVLLASHLEPETARELLAAATHKTKAEIERLVAERFPRRDVAARVAATQSPPLELAADEHSPGNVDGLEMTTTSEGRGAPGHPHGRVEALSAEAYAVQFTRGREADQRFRYLQDLLGHAVARGDIAEVYRRAVNELIAKIERVRFGACAKPRAGAHHTSDDPRQIPLHVKRAVWRRDGGQCTFVGDTGHRCEARGDVEFDHVREVARGGEASVDGLQLRCRGHNQYTAEKTFGAGFMKQKRAEAKAAAARRRAEREHRAEQSRLRPHEEEVIPWLRQLGFQAEESKLAALRCREMADAPLEDRVKRALTWFGDRCARITRPAALA